MPKQNISARMHDVRPADGGSFGTGFRSGKTSNSKLRSSLPLSPVSKSVSDKPDFSRMNFGYFKPEDFGVSDPSAPLLPDTMPKPDREYRKLEYRPELDLPTRPASGENNYREKTPRNNPGNFSKIGTVFRLNGAAARKVSYFRKFAWPDLSGLTETLFGMRFDRSALYFLLSLILVGGVMSGMIFFNRASQVRTQVIGSGEAAYGSIGAAIEGLKNRNFQASLFELRRSYQSFSEASDKLSELGDSTIRISKFIPYASKLSSGKQVLEAGKDLTLVGESFVRVSESLDRFMKGSQQGDDSLLTLLQSTRSELVMAGEHINEADKHLAEVRISDLPDDLREKYLMLKQSLPEISRLNADFLKNSDLLADLFGGNGPRKYLFLFQNNQEMRATGGFIGSYALLEISNGKIRNFFIDEIYNPDGQLKERIVPPLPIQKISTNWSLHDSNWYPDFPTSARLAADFYEMTGGPTVDGVIALTPNVMQKLLKITGPIALDEYGVIINAENFVEKTQHEVEVDYDKELNRPKKILSDLAPIVMQSIMGRSNPKMAAELIKIATESLSEKHLIIYSSNDRIQQILAELGWTGELLPTGRDYLSVINSNINGYKTDGVIQETIEHVAEIRANGTIVDTVTITRQHKGGLENYDWWNRVNADYQRIYVPSGSKLISVEGQTREINTSPIDYDKLGFKRNFLVQQEESNMLIDDSSGTRIYEENGKTVFANWVYVSPQETAVVKYRYELPFRLFSSEESRIADNYSLIIQKQSGSWRSRIRSKISYTGQGAIYWSYPEDLKSDSNQLQWEADLDTDKFIGAAIGSN